jgi:NAD(P)-dependent dehydrogenase (short-subunit alcohol dehydrogenase family)
VCLTARRPEPLAEAAAALPPASAAMVEGKADDPARHEDVIGRVAEEFGGLDILMLNAGINPACAPIVELDLDAARKILEVNVIAARVDTAGPDSRTRFRRARRGRCSLLGHRRHALTRDRDVGHEQGHRTHLARTMAAELGPNVRANAVAPAVVGPSSPSLSMRARKRR